MKISQSTLGAFVVAIVVFAGFEPPAQAKTLRGDADGDGLSTWTETKRLGTNPHRADTDRDRLSDGVEVKRTRTNPRRIDTDGDSLSDWTELRRTGTNPRKGDSDRDGFSDAEEVVSGSDPRNPASTPGLPPGPSAPGPSPGPNPPQPTPGGGGPPPPDTTPPQTTIVSSPPATAAFAAATFAFKSSESESHFECGIDGTTFAACTSPKEYTALAEGSHDFEVRAIDVAGNVDSSPAAHSWMVDTTAPAVQIDSGPSGLTNDSTPTFGFSSEAGTNLECSIDSGTPAFGLCSSATSHTPPSSLSQGPHTFRVRATDAAGNQTSATRSFTVDTTAPDPPDLAATLPPSPASDITPQVVGTSPAGTTVKLYTSADCSGLPLATGTAAALEAGLEVSVPDDSTTTFRATATTVAANISGCSEPLAYVEDSGAPDTEITAKPAELVNNATATFILSGSDPGGSGVLSLECRRDGGAWAPCTSPKEYASLAEGAHSFEVKAIDQAGNVDASPATHSWQIDLSAPSVTIDSLSKSLVKAGETSELIWHTNENGSFELRVGGADCSTGMVIDSGSYGAQPAQRVSNVSATQLAEGINTLRLCLTDAAGNRGSATSALSKDTGAPDTTIGTKPAALVNTATAILTFSGSDVGGSGVASFECRRDGGAWSACTSPKEYVGLADAAHSFEVKVVDQAGNVDGSPATHSWTVDTTPPALQINTGPSGLTNDSTPTFGFSSEPGASLECSLDSGTPAFGLCSGANGHTPPSPLPDGSHAFRVRATDSATNQAIATRSFNIDTAAPDAPSLNAMVPASPANDNTPQVIGTAPTGNTIRLYASADCSGSPVATVATAELETGVGVSVPDDSTTTFGATATTAAANTSGCSEPLVYVEDSSAPDTQIAAKPAALTNTTSATFTFSGSDPGGAGGASFECRRDGGAWTACTSPKEYASLPVGAHSFEVKAIDKAGNADPTSATHNWQVDLTAPQPAIDSLSKALLKAGETSELTWHANENGTFELRVGGADCSAGTVIASGSYANQPAIRVSNVTAAQLAEGANILRLCLTDAAGNRGATTSTLSKDTGAPETTIGTKPAALVNAATATFTFSGSDAGGSGVASLECRRDGGAWSVCTSPREYTGLAEGAHTFEVKTVDQAGNVDQTPATHSWQIDLSAPSVTVDSLSKSLLKAGETSELTWHANENGSFDLRVGGADCTAGTVVASGSYANPPSQQVSNVSAAQLAEGANTLRLCLADAAGNRGQASATLSKDTGAPDTTIGTKPAALVNTATANFTFSGNDGSGSGIASFECRIDGGAWATCTSPKQFTELTEGAHSFEVKAIDKAGNVDQTPATYSWQIDLSAPSVTIDSLSKALLKAGETSELTWHAGENGAFELRVGGADCTAGTVVASGSYANQPAQHVSSVTASQVAEGANTLRLCLADAAGNRGSAATTVSKDTGAPETQIDTKPAALVNSAVANFTFSGSDGSGSGIAAFECRRDGGAWGVCTSPREYAGLADGAHSFEVKAIDKAGNVDGSPASHSWQIDLSAPSVTIDNLSKALIKAGESSDLTWHANENGSFELRVGGADCTAGTVVASGSYANQPSQQVSNVTAAQLAEGANTLRLCLADAAGNRGVATSTVSKDTGAPGTTIGTKPAALVNSGTASFTFSGSDPAGSGVASFECRRDGGIWGACTSPREYTGLAEGAHTFEVKAIDKAGNVDGSPASHSWQIDLSAPSVTIDNLSKALIKAGESSDLTWHANENGSFELRVGGADCSAGTVVAAGSYANQPATRVSSIGAAQLAEGANTLRLCLTDAAGNRGQASATLSKDTGAPETQITAKPNALTNSATASFTFSGSDLGGSGVASFECRRDGGAWSACTSPREYVGLADGAHSFEVKAIDAAGNIDQTPAISSWTIDSKAPETTIGTKPAALVNAATATFTFSGSDAGGSGVASLECRRDGGAWSVCISPREYTGLAEGAHTFEVKAIDQAGNVDPTPATHSWQIDLSAPSVIIDSLSKSLLKAGETSELTWHANENGSFELRVGGVDCTVGTVVASGSYANQPNQHVSNVSAAQLAEGANTLRLCLADAAGNRGQASATLSKDTGAPETQITTKPNALTNSAIANFTFSGSDPGGSGVASFECRRDGGVWAACTSPKEYAGLAEGAHSFEVKAIDAAGNVDGSPATHSWTIDTKAPDTQIAAKPAALTTSTTASFTFNGSDVGGSGIGSLECRRDGGAWSTCTSPHEYTGLAEGAHSFEVKAIDKAGNVDQSPASFNWTVDTTPPTVQIDSGPSGLTNDSTPAFGFSSEPGADLECSIDSGTPAFGPCSGATTHTPPSSLSEGAHTFRLRAADPAGNQATATRNFTVDTTAPQAPELGSTTPASPANDNTPQVIGVAPANTTVKLYTSADCSGSPLATGSAAALEAGLEVSVPDDSTTTFRATATTAAENTSGCSEPLAYVEDSGAPDTQIATKPASPTNSATATFTFSGSDSGGSGVASLECRRDGGAWAACASPKEYVGLAEGGHTFEVKAIDQAGNVDATPATHSWQIDLTAPQPAIDSLSKALLKAGETSELTWHANENGSFELRVGGADCSVGTVVASGSYANQPATQVSNVNAAQLAEGANTLRLCLADAAGNRGQAITTLSRDTGAPNTQITAKPAALTNATNATFAFSGSDPGGSGVASFECRRDGGAWSACTSPKEYVALAEDSHDFEVKAIDAAGNADASPASFDWTVDTTAPAVHIDSGPSGLTNDSTPTFGFSSEPGVGFECSIDSGAPAFGPCSGAGSHTPASPLSDGPHTFRVRATDAASNQAAATRSFSIDIAAPRLSSTDPPSPANDNQPRVIGNAPVNTTLKLYTSADCSGSPLVAVPAAELEMGIEVSVPDDSTTLFYATATTPAESTSGCAEPLTYVEDSSAPETTIASSPPAATLSTLASFFLAASEPGSSFECKLDEAAFAACASPHSYADLAFGSHSFSVRGTDAAGNVDPTPIAWSWTIEPPTSPPPSACVAGSVQATTAAQVRSAVQGKADVCVTADVGNVNLSSLGSRPVVVSTDGGSMGDVDLASTTDLTISRARIRSVEMRSSHRTQLLANTIGGTQTNRVLDQLIFMPETNNDVAIEGNDIGWTLADASGNTGYGCRCYGALNRLRFVGNKLHDLAADGIQGVDGNDVLIDRNEIGPVGRNPESTEHSDNIQITGNGANLHISNNWIHHQGYYEGNVTANAGSTYIHGGSASSLFYENNLIETAQGRTEICGLGTGGEERSNIAIRRNTWVDGGLAFNGFPGFEWDCDAGTGNTVERNIAVDPDGGLKLSSFASAASFTANLWGQPSLVTLDPAGNCTSANCNPAGEEPIGYRKPSGVSW